MLNIHSGVDSTDKIVPCGTIEGIHEKSLLVYLFFVSLNGIFYSHDVCNLGE